MAASNGDGTEGVRRRSAFTSGYSVRDVAKLLKLTPARIHSYVRAGFLEPRRGARGEFRFTLQDVVLLRTARELSDHVPERKVRSALLKLRDQLPSGRPLSAVRITAEGANVVVRDGASVWDPESGQALLDFGVAEIASQVAPLARRAAREALRLEQELGADDWYELACDLEPVAIDEARDAYRRALELDPGHAAARINLGRLLHEAGHPEAAALQYLHALATTPDDGTAAFNLGVALEDLGRTEEAIDAYERALRAEPGNADAHYNAAALYERLGDRTAAFRHLKAYKKLTDGP